MTKMIHSNLSNRIRSFHFQDRDTHLNNTEQSRFEKVQNTKIGKVAVIADDDEFFRMAMGVILKDRLGFTSVIEAVSLDDALECLSSRDDVSLALFDLAMPGMKSASSLRHVRESFPEQKIVVVSGSQRRADVLLALGSGVNGYVPKCLGSISIRNALAMVMNGQVYVPPLISELDEEERAADTPQYLLESLTPRQKEILQLLVKAKSNKEIARALDLGEGTVKVHMSALFRNLGTRSRSATAVIGAQLFS